MLVTSGKKDGNVPIAILLQKYSINTNASSFKTRKECAQQQKVVTSILYPFG